MDFLILKDTKCICRRKEVAFACMKLCICKLHVMKFMICYSFFKQILFSQVCDGRYQFRKTPGSINRVGWYPFFKEAKKKLE